MPTITINELFIHDGTNLDELRQFRWSNGSGADTGEQSALMSAAGQTIIIDSPGAVTTHSYLLRGLSIADREWLRFYRGRFILLRDSRGIRDYGAYGGLPWENWNNPRVTDIQIAFTTISHDESV